MTSSVRCLFTNFSPRNLGDCLMVDAAIHGVIAINQAATILLPQNTHDIDFHINSGQVKRLRIPDYRNFANQPRRAKLGSLMSGPFQDFRFWKRENVDLIFDISGFYIGGGHDSQRARNIINHYRKGVESGAKLIVLPKTFGPLSNNSDKDLVAELFDLSSIFFCRDQKSLETVSKEFNLDLIIPRRYQAMQDQVNILSRPLQSYQMFECWIGQTRSLQRAFFHLWLRPSRFWG